MSDTAERLFRSAALKKLSSPEDLDRLVRITRPIGWVAGLALAVMLACGIAWSLLGALPTRVPGSGILLSQGGRVIEVPVRGAGILTALDVALGDRVQAGQVIGRLGESEGERELLAARAQLAERQRDLETAEAAALVSQRLRGDSLQRQRQALELRLRIARLRETTLRERLDTSEALFRDRLITRNQLIAVQNELQVVLQELSNAASDAARLGAEEEQAQRAAEDRLIEQRRAVSELARRAATLEGNLGGQLTIRAPAAGTVVELRSHPGDLLRGGQAVVAIEQQGEGLEVVSFIDSARGKQLRPGMEARVALSSARREEYGTLLGTVTAVSDFPLSFDAVRAILQNEDLARSFLRNGPPFLARIRLQPDPGTASGYRWTSRRGDTVAVSSGIPAMVEIVTESRRPIALVIPALRKLLAL